MLGWMISETTRMPNKKETFGMLDLDAKTEAKS
jgi:hypothetical protein